MIMGWMSIVLSMALGLFMVMAGPCFAQNGTTLTFSAKCSSPPFKWVNEKGDIVGIDIDIIKEACRRAGMKAEIKNVPWKRVLLDVETGNSDGGFSASIKPEREVFAHFITSQPIHRTTFSVFVLKKNAFSYHGVADLHGKRIGKMRGYFLGDEFSRAENAGLFEVDEVESIEGSITKLLLGRVDLLVENSMVAKYTLREMDIRNKEDIVELPNPVTRGRAAYLMISKAAKIKDKAMVIEKLTNALQSMADDGTFDKIHHKYTR